LESTLNIDEKTVVEEIKNIILEKNDWTEIQEIADIMGVPRYKQLQEGSHNSTIAQLINSHLKKLGFRTIRIDFDEGDYNIWVCPPGAGNGQPGNILKLNTNNKKYKTVMLFTDNLISEQISKPKEINPDTIISCVKRFNKQFGTGGITKILHGSSALKDNEYNKLAKESEFYGIYSDFTQKNIETEIKNLIAKNKIKQIKGFMPTLEIPENETETAKTEIPEPKELPGEKVKNEDTKDLDQITELLKNGENLFITGYAGTGKSYILNKLKNKFDIEVTSTTGMAAVNIQGQTIHSWAGVGICSKPIEQVVKNILKRTKIRKQIVNCNILAIDEISMLDARTLDYIDNVLKMVREEDSPFGGIQVLFFGDFFQLPPVRKAESGFCFNSECWNKLNLQTVFLQKIYRQKDENFIRALNNIRLNSMTETDVELLSSRMVEHNTYNSDMLHIFSTNGEADSYNARKFDAVSNPVHIFTAEDKLHRNNRVIKINPENLPENLNHYDKLTWETLNNSCKAPQVLELKEGCKVMLLKNHNFAKGLINGSCGVVLKIESNSVKIKFDNDVQETITNHTFELYREGELAATREQLPLRLAYGITIHKSQGMTLDKVVVDCNRIFECGQAYVALSRVKSLEGLYLRSFNPRKVVVDEEVINFYERQR